MKGTKFPIWNTVFVFTPIILILLFFLFNYADAGGLVTSCNTGEIDTLTGNYKNACGFNQLVTQINDVIHFLLFVIATPIFSLILIYTGFLFIRAGGNSEIITKAKKIFFNAIVGYVIALAAWLIVSTILKSLGFTGENYLDGSTLPAQENSTTSIPQNPIPDDDGVLYVGGSYEEENPNGNSCSINLESLPIEPSAYVPTFRLGINKALADNDDIYYKQEQAKRRAEEFRKARCWLIGWYKNRKIIDPRLQTEFESFKPMILKNLENPKFEILDEEAYDKKYPDSLAITLPGGIIFSSGKIVIKNINSDITYTSIHELAHYSEENGNLIPGLQTIYLQSIFPRNYFEKYFSDFLNTDPVYWHVPNGTGEDPHFFNHTIERYYCYMILSVQNGTCFSINELNKPNPYIKDKTIFYELKTNKGSSFTEVHARLMVIRYIVGADSDKPFPQNSLPSIDKILRIPFKTSMADHNFLTTPFPSENLLDIPSGAKSDLFTIVGIPIIAKNSCESKTVNNSTKIYCDSVNPDGTKINNTSQIFSSINEAQSWMNQLIFSKISDLMNKTM